MFALVVLVVGSLIGVSSAPDDWFAALAKPGFEPPNWVFGPVWAALYVLIGIAGGRTYLRDAGSPPMFLWILQMVLKWAWSPAWFTLHLLWLALALIVLTLLLAVGFIVTSWKVDRTAAWLFVPYAVWVAFAAMLNLSIALMN